jgi:hypothetical protein
MARKSKARARKQIAGVKVPKALGSTAKGMLANPLARELLAAALVHLAAMLIESQSVKASATRRLVSGLGDAGKRAGTFGSTTMGQALDTLRAYWSKPRSGDALAERQQARSKRSRIRTKKSRARNRADGAGKSRETNKVPAVS